MLSALIIAADARVPVSASPEAMARSLAALVPAAIRGLLRDVTLAALAGAAQADSIADHAGCGLAEAASPQAVLAAGLARARGERILLLRAGYAPEAGFVEELADQFDRDPGSAPRSAILHVRPETFLARLLPLLSPVEALIVRRADIGKNVDSLAGLRGALIAPMRFRCRLRRVV